MAEVGWDGLTTNAIAERAGVNIGSLYQFFPNKEAVVAELQRRHAAAAQADLQQAMDRLPDQPSLRAGLTVIMEMIVRRHRVTPVVHRIVMEELPYRVRCVEDDREQNQARFLEWVTPFMKGVPDPDLVIDIMSVAAQTIIHKVTAERPELLDDPSLIEELVALFEPYLCRPRVADR